MNRADRVIQIASALFAFGLFAYFIKLVSDDRLIAAATITPAIGLALLGTRLEDLTRINFFKVFEAELRERLKEVNATLAQLHDLAELLGRVTIRQLKYGGRWSSFGPREQRALIDEVLKRLEGLKVPKDRLDALADIERPVDHFDYFHYVIRAAHDVMTHEQSKAWEHWSQPFILLGIGHEPTPEQTAVFLAEQELLSGEVQQRLEDYRQYHAQGTHRRPDCFLDRRG